METNKQLRVAYDLLEFIGDPEDYIICKWQGELFTGIAYENYLTGKRMTETVFRNGIEYGLDQEWYETGQLRSCVYRYGQTFIGKNREWHENGQLKLEEEFMGMYVIHRIVWDSFGNMLVDWTMPDSDSARNGMIEREIKLQRLKEADQNNPTECNG